MIVGFGNQQIEHFLAIFITFFELANLSVNWKKLIDYLIFIDLDFMLDISVKSLNYIYFQRL